MARIVLHDPLERVDVDSAPGSPTWHVARRPPVDGDPEDEPLDEEADELDEDEEDDLDDDDELDEEDDLDDDEFDDLIDLDDEYDDDDSPPPVKSPFRE